MKTPATQQTKTRFYPALAFFLSAGALMLLLFSTSLKPGWVHFSNDAPLGTYSADWLSLPEGFSGMWYDLNWVGFGLGTAAIIPSNLTRAVIGAVNYAKFYQGLALLFLGCGAWYMFRRFGLKPFAAGIAAIAVPLNSTFFSAAAWGVGSQQVGLGFNLFAIGLIFSAQSGNHRWIRLVLAGFAVGIGVMEAVDLGAIFSIFTGAFAVYLQFARSTGSAPKRIGKGVLDGAIVALCALLIASQTLIVLIETQIKGTTVGDQQTRSKAENWNWATQWSLPKAETLQIIVPGLFGYRMDTPDGGNYWGSVGRDPALDEYFRQGRTGPTPPGMMRFSGGGIYSGVAVCLIAFWAIAQLLARNPVFSPFERKVLWFWFVAGFISLLLAYGRFAPFYQFVYALPYFSTIRNPAKFINTFQWALLIVFGYGLHGIISRYIKADSGPAHPAVLDQFKAWWPKAGLFERRWIVGCLVTLGISLLAWLIYSSSRTSLEAYLLTVGFDANLAPLISGFSIRQVGWFILFFIISAGLMALIMAGVFSGARARVGFVLLALVLVTDLARANMPWIVHWDYREKYATNPVIDTLRQEPWEARIVIFPNYLLNVFQMPPEMTGAQQYLSQFYGIEWAQHHFPYYNIQSLDLIQMPRAPLDYENFEGALQPRTATDISTLIARRWELTNTRYILAATPFISLPNQHIDPEKQRFQILQQFEIVPKPGVTRPQKYEELTAMDSTNGNFALIEFTGALPRARLYQNWQVQTNSQETLARMAAPAFDPHETVLLSEPVPATPPVSEMTQPSATNAGSVNITSYAPKRIVLEAKAPEPSILLLNDRHDPDWKVLVNGKPERIQRANYLMRAVFLPAGEHRVEFRYNPPTKMLYPSVAAMIAGVLLVGFLVVAGRREDGEDQPPNKSS
jgi:hypothetical protein